MPYQSVYSATKYAVRGYILSLHHELQRSGINVSLVSPGPVETQMLTREASDLHSATTFICKPINAAGVASAVLDLIMNPKHELILPSRNQWIALSLNLFPRLTSFFYSMLNFVGRIRLNAYRSKYAKELYSLAQEEVK